MTHKAPRTPRDPSGLISTRWLLASALAASIGCDAITATRESTAAIATSPTQSFVARPRQRLVFTAVPSAPTAEVEAYFKANILPAMIRDRRIGDVAVSVGRDGQYIVELELRTSTAPESLAVDVLATGKSLAEGESLLEGFAKYFDIRNARQLAPRADLSIARSVIGSIEGGAP